MAFLQLNYRSSSPGSLCTSFLLDRPLLCNRYLRICCWVGSSLENWDNCTLTVRHRSLNKRNQLTQADPAVQQLLSAHCNAKEKSVSIRSIMMLRGIKHLRNSTGQVPSSCLRKSPEEPPAPPAASRARDSG